MSRFNTLVAAASEDVCDMVSSYAASIAAETGEGRSAAHNALVSLVKKSMHASRPDVVDARAALWRVRIQLLPIVDGAGIEADTDPELSDVTAPGSLYIHGLPSVADALRDMATQFHSPRVLEGLGAETLAHSLRGFRPTLSRLNGAAVWRPRYMVRPHEGDLVQPVAGSLKGLTGGSRPAEHWRAEVRVQKCDS